MSKFVFKKWFETYRTVTEVDFNGVDQWEDGDVEIAFIEGYWKGQVDAYTKLLSLPLPYTSRVPKTLLNVVEEQIRKFQEKLDKALAKRGNREEVGGVNHESYDARDKKVYQPSNSMTQSVALSKYAVMPEKDQLKVLDHALSYMEQSNSQSRERCIARGVATVKGMELR